MPIFCDQCGSLMKVKEEKETVIIYECPVCGYTKSVPRDINNAPKGITINTSDPDDIDVIIDESKITKKGTLVNAKCPKCGHEKAYVVLMQTRAADEPPTRIYRCEKCGYTWREYS
ncbi:MAG: transcription factor S [Candidatus Njordarchaeia archaeon]